MALIKEVLPEPTFASVLVDHRLYSSFRKNLPGAPATSTLNLPIAFPRSVKGRRLGILMLGMINCEAPANPRRGEGRGPSSSSPDPIAWLLISSVMEISSNGRRDWLEIDFGLLGSDDGSSG